MLYCFCVCFVCQIQFLHPTEVFLSSRSQKAWNKEIKYRKCQSRDKGDKPSTRSGRLSSASQGLQAVTAQTTCVYSGGTSRHSAYIRKSRELYAQIMCWNGCVVAEVVNWLHVSLQAAPLALQPSCNTRPWSPKSSLRKMKMQRNCYRWGSAEMIEMTAQSVTVKFHKNKGYMYWLMLTPLCHQGSQDMAYWHDWWNQLSGFQRQLILLMSMADDFWSSLTEGQKTATGNKHILHVNSSLTPALVYYLFITLIVSLLTGVFLKMLLFQVSLLSMLLSFAVGGFL